MLRADTNYTILIFSSNVTIKETVKKNSWSTNMAIVPGIEVSKQSIDTYPTAEFLFGILEAIRHEVDRLVILILVLLNGGGFWLERSMLAFAARERVKKLPIGGQKAGTVGFHIRPLFAEAEFDGEPVNRGQFLDFLVGGTERSEADFLGELSEAWIGQQRHVSQELVDAISANRAG